MECAAYILSKVLECDRAVSGANGGSSVLGGGSLPRTKTNAYHSHPKDDNPEVVAEFRPVSLCNVSYRILRKVLVGRLIPLLH